MKLLFLLCIYIYIINTVKSEWSVSPVYPKTIVVSDGMLARIVDIENGTLYVAKHTDDVYINLMVCPYTSHLNYRATSSACAILEWNPIITKFNTSYMPEISKIKNVKTKLNCYDINIMFNEDETADSYVDIMLYFVPTENYIQYTTSIDYTNIYKNELFNIDTISTKCLPSIQTTKMLNFTIYIYNNIPNVVDISDKIKTANDITISYIIFVIGIVIIISCKHTDK